MTEVELLYASGCPNVEPARAQIRRALRQAGLPPRWREWRVDTPDAPAHARGYGSPTVLVDRRDVAGAETAGATTSDATRSGATTSDATTSDATTSASETADSETSGCGACCRLYPGAEGTATGVPSLDQILDAIRRDTRNRSDSPSYTPVAEERQASAAWSDEALMAAYQHGDVQAFDLLFGRYQDRLYGYFVRRFGDRELAADLFQRVFLRVHRARKRYDPDRSFAAWVFGIASNLGKDELKRRHRRPGDVTWDAPEHAPTAASTGTPEAQLVSQERARWIADALAALPDSQREVIVLHKVEGLSFPEIAEARGEKVEAVKSRAFRGYRALRRILDAGESGP